MSPPGSSALASSEDLAALRRVREKLRGELDAVRRLLAEGREGGAERLSLLAQGLEGRGHHASSLLLDELCLAVHAATGEGARDPAALAAGLDVLARLLEGIGGAAGSPLAALAEVDALRAARGAELASASLPWEPASWQAAPESGIGPLALRLRPYLQKGLVGWLRDAGDGEALSLVDAVFERLAQAAEPGSPPALLACAARAWAEHLRGVPVRGAVHRRLLGGFDRELRALGAGEAPSVRVLRSVAHELLARGAAGPRARALLDASGLDRAEDLLPERGRTARRSVAALLERAADGVSARADRTALLAELVAAADALAFLGEGVARREVLVLASTLDERGAGDRLRGLASAITGGSRALHAVIAPPGLGGEEELDEEVIPPSLLGDLDRAQNLFTRLGEIAPDDPGDADGDAPWLPPELQAVLESAVPEGETEAAPEPVLEGIDLATLAERARGLLTEVDAEDEAPPEEPRVERVALDEVALEDLTAVAGSMGEAQSGLEHRVGGLRDSLGDMARAIAGLRGQLERIGESRVPSPGPGSKGVREEGLVAVSAGLEELATLHEAATRLTRETESLLVRQARDHVDLQRGLLRTRLVPVSSRAAAWEAATGASLSIEGGDARVDQSMLAGVSPIVEALLGGLSGGGDAGGTPLRITALVADGELHLELHGPPTALEGAVVADAEAAMLELGGRLHHLEGDGSESIVALRAPLALPLRRVLTMESAGEVLALPLDAVEGVTRPGPDAIAGEDESRTIVHAGREYPLGRLDRVLGLGAPEAPLPARAHVVLLRARGAHAAVAVDAVRERNEVIARALDPQLAAIPWLAGACVLGAERPVLILDPERLVGALIRAA